MSITKTQLPTHIFIADAIALGHKYFVEDENGERLLVLKDHTGPVDLVDLDVDKATYLLCEKEPRHYGLSADDIRDTIVSQVESQDEYGDEDGTLCDAVDDAFKARPDLFHELSNVLNEHFKGRDFYFATKTQIIFDNE